MMTIKERILASALGAILHDKGSEIILHDAEGSFHFSFDDQRGALLVNELDPEEPLSRAALGGTLIVQNVVPKSLIN